MPLIHHTTMGLSSPSSATTLVFVLVSFLYVRGWVRTRGRSARAMPPRRAASFLFGVCLIWVAIASPLVAYDHAYVQAGQAVPLA